MNKRGDSQIDWIISLGIFLLYIAWFFIFIRPYSTQEQIPNLVDIVKQNFDREAYWSVEKLPIIVDSTGYLRQVPVVVDVPFGFAEPNSYMNNRAFVIDGGKLFFIANLNISNIFYIIHSNESYIMYNQITDLTATQQRAIVTDFSADFVNSTLASAFYSGTKILSFSATVDGKPIDVSNSSFSDKKIAGQYAIKNQALNLTSYVFAYNPAVYMFFSTNKSISQNLELEKYESYFFDNSENGNLNHAGECHHKNAAMLLFSGQNTNILFAFDRNADFNFCTQNTSITLQIDFEGSAEERIIFFTGSSGDYINYISGYNTQTGIGEELRGISLASIQALSLSNYNDVKYRWGSPDFRIFVKNSTNDAIISTIGSTPYEKATVYAKEERNFLLDKSGSLEDIKISSQAWT